MSNQGELHVVYGTGPVGLAVIDELAAQGKRVKAVNRSGRAAVPAGVEVVAGDGSDADSTRTICQGATHVYNCTNPPYHRWPELFPGIQAGILEGAAAAGAKLIVMENLYMYGPTGGKPLTEDLPYQPREPKGVTRAKMARDLMAAHASGKVRAVAARASDFFGPRVQESTMGWRVLYPVVTGGAAQVLGNPDVPHTYTYLPDVGKALVLLGARDEALGQAWHIPSPPTMTARAFVERLYQEAGHPVKIQVPPTLVLRVIGLFTPGLREMLKVRYQVTEPFIMDHGKFAAAFGDISTSLDEAIRATVAWYRANPKA